MPPFDRQQRNNDLAILSALAATLHHAVDLRETLDIALGHIVDLMGLTTGWIFLKDEGDHYTLAARHHVPPALAYPGPAWDGDCTCQDLCQAGKLDHSVAMLECSRLRDAVGDKRGLAQHASVPITSTDGLLGLLNVATTRWGRLAPADLQLLTIAGHMLGMAMARLHLYEQVKVRRVQEQRALLSLSQDLLMSESLEPALQRLTRVGTRLLEADACAFVEADELAGRAVLRAAHGWQLPAHAPWPLPLDPSSPHLWYLPERATSLSDEALAELPPLLRQQHFKGYLGLPVELGGVPVGTLMVASRSPRLFLDDEAQLLGILSNLLVQTLERERLQYEAMAREKLEQELELAREIQASFLPNCCPVMAGYQIEAYYRAARQVGGDFYDFIPLPARSASPSAVPSVRAQSSSVVYRGGTRIATPEAPDLSTAQRIGIVIADVTDKGVPAALFMALSRTLLRATAIDGRRPDEVLERANRLILADSRAGLFVTCFYAIIEIDTGLVSFANGGHNYPLLWQAATRTVRPLRAQGIVLGIVPEPTFELQEFVMAPGDVLLFYTDGITEAMNQARELFGDERLTEILIANHQRSPEEIIQAVLAHVTAFASGQNQSDDITMVVIKRNATPSAA
ncbi:SpoIIE family protein phosphatase [Candidatus Chloroploca sp. M-50]|uniref:SpoIIE family protein phosphatase n=1 Tax=Candidatus Chloroploca mongolica TaxID=2528176 RepID=A0ABS4DA73_9CHLR|nr:SpoIIE family protein phosphatase [Candidatus Chloroploca mongolica]MBP1466345.1 SpoIIE family protein phosphatase [Candidatus Chloroploca mongolica]